MININATQAEAIHALATEYGIDLEIPRSLRHSDAITTLMVLAGNGAQLYMPVAHDRLIIIDCHGGVSLVVSLDARNRIVINALADRRGHWRKVYLKTALSLFGNYVGVRKARAFSSPMR